MLISLLFNFSNPTIHCNYDEALAIAQKENKHILMIFAGSDWCRPCKKFKASILESGAFQSWAQEELVILYVDFPIKKSNQLPENLKKQNSELASRFNESGIIPQMVLVDKDENLIKTIEFHYQTIAEFISDCKTHDHIAGGR